MSRPVHYHEYLQLDQILNAQNLESKKHGREAHDEMLFITIHQTYELWFKQILHELSSVLSAFKTDRVSESMMGIAASRLSRIVEIQRVLIDQINILETMTPLDFLDFRDLLFPASGFQSFQFRLLEIQLGLREQDRLTYNNSPYHAHLPDNQRKMIQNIENQPSLFDLVEKWLERTPILKDEDFNFWQSYQRAVKEMFTIETDLIERNQFLNEQEKQRNLQMVEKSKEIFAALFDEEKYNELRQQGAWRLSYRAMHGALVIQLYRDEPAFQQPFRLISYLLDIDENFTQWRYRHALMARRMLGTKVGTGGSSGSDYLKASADKHKIFSDFFQLTTFFIRKSALPQIPAMTKKRLGFRFSEEV